MAEYIEREAVMKTVKDGNHSDSGRSMADLTSLREVLEDTPTADVSEVKHGKWRYIPHYNGFYDCAYICNVCKKISLEKGNYCPNCGARMDGEGE